jgi:hypothetical protein
MLPHMPTGQSPQDYGSRLSSGTSISCQRTALIILVNVASRPQRGPPTLFTLRLQLQPPAASRPRGLIAYTRQSASFLTFAIFLASSLLSVSPGSCRECLASLLRYLTIVNISSWILKPTKLIPPETLLKSRESLIVHPSEVTGEHEEHDMDSSSDRNANEKHS